LEDFEGLGGNILKISLLATTVPYKVKLMTQVEAATSTGLIIKPRKVHNVEFPLSFLTVSPHLSNLS